MEQQPVRRRRRRRRSSRARSEAVAWFVYIAGFVKRLLQLIALLLVIGFILELGLGRPDTPFFDRLFSFYDHW